MSKLKVTTISDPDNNNTALTVASDGKVTLAQDTTFSGNVGIGTSSPSAGTLTLTNKYILQSNSQMKIGDNGLINSTTADGISRIDYYTGKPFLFTQSGSERMRIDSSGNLLINTTDSTPIGSAVNGTVVGNGMITSAKYMDVSLKLDRYGDSGAANNGAIVNFSLGGTTVGRIGGSASRLWIGEGSAGLYFDHTSYTALRPFSPNTGGLNDNTVDLGSSGNRFKDLYLSGGAYIGGTGSANYLDDYEEGTFNPTITPNTSGTLTLNSSFNTLSYVKVGNVVHIFGAIRIGSLSSPTGNNVQITTPFTVNQVNQMSTRSGSATRINFGSPSVTGIYPTYSAENSNKIYINLNPSGFAVGNDIYIGETLYVY